MKYTRRFEYLKATKWNYLFLHYTHKIELNDTNENVLDCEEKIFVRANMKNQHAFG